MFFKKKKKAKEAPLNLSDKLMDIVNSQAFLLFSSCLGKNEEGQDVLNHSLIVSSGFKVDDVQLAIDEMTRLSTNFKEQLSKRADQEVDKLTKEALEQSEPADIQPAPDSALEAEATGTTTTTIEE
jgi:hypothetical protein